MEPTAIAEAFSMDKDSAMEYLEKEDLLSMLYSIVEQHPNRIPPDYRDLARLHLAIRSRRVFTILEFGSGYSTVVMAAALLKNKQEWVKLGQKPEIRNSTPFELHAVESEETWADSSRCIIPSDLDGIIDIHVSECRVGLFRDRACHYYEALPDIVPDFIYLDGPDPTTVKGNIGGLSWKNVDRVVTAGDALRIEPQLLPGTMIIIDGRSSNARFLTSHLYRNWLYESNYEGDISVLELQEKPLGSINRATLLHCLGERVLTWNS